MKKENPWHLSSEFPKPSNDDPNISVDVITQDIENGKATMLNIGFYNFDSKTWYWHTDTLIDHYEKNDPTDFVWMYAPEYKQL